MQLHYGYGMKDSKVALIQVDTTNTVITGDKISNITITIILFRFIMIT